MTTAENPRPPFPPFDTDAATKKVRMAEDAWNTRDPERVALAYTPDSVWRNRAEFFSGRDAIREFLVRKWSRELDYPLIKELWADLSIAAGERRFHWPLGRRPGDHPSLSELGL